LRLKISNNLFVIKKGKRRRKNVNVTVRADQSFVDVRTLFALKFLYTITVFNKFREQRRGWGLDSAQQTPYVQQRTEGQRTD